MEIIVGIFNARKRKKWGIKMSNKVVCFPLFIWGHGLSVQIWFMYDTHSCIVFNDVRECLTQEKRRLQHFPEDCRTLLILNYHSRSLIRALCFQATQSRCNAQLIVMLSNFFVLSTAGLKRYVMLSILWYFPYLILSPKRFILPLFNFHTTIKIINSSRKML